MKLLRFLERRLGEGVAQSVLYKWVRTGQVRVNGGRARPHVVLAEGDAVRLPPFAAPPARTGEAETSGSAQPQPLGAPPDLGPGLTPLARAGDVLVLNKAAGLASQPGGGDSVASRLRKAFRASAFVPAPAHRLDKHTSGLMVAGLSHRAQRHLHELVKEGGLIKEYLAWVCGCPWDERPRLLRDALFVACEGKKELVAARPDKAGEVRLAPRPASEWSAGPDARKHLCAAPGGVEGATGGGSPALCVVAVVMRLGPPDLPGALQSASPLLAARGATLLLIRLLTGRKHQIRVQFASRGCPIIGDGRYGGPRFSRMLLHAFALSFTAPGEGGSFSFAVSPDWPEPFSLEAASVASARERLRGALQ